MKLSNLSFLQQIWWLVHVLECKLRSSYFAQQDFLQMLLTRYIWFFASFSIWSIFRLFWIYLSTSLPINAAQTFYKPCMTNALKRDSARNYICSSTARRPMIWRCAGRWPASYRTIEQSFLAKYAKNYLNFFKQSPKNQLIFSSTALPFMILDAEFNQDKNCIESIVLRSGCTITSFISMVFIIRYNFDERKIFKIDNSLQSWHTVLLSKSTVSFEKNHVLRLEVNFFVETLFFLWNTIFLKKLKDLPLQPIILAKFFFCFKLFGWNSPKMSLFKKLSAVFIS